MDVLITIGGIGGLGTGLDVSGGGALIANAVLNLFGGKNASVVVLTIVIAVLTSVLTNFMSNNATAADGQMFICADHGNAEYMIDEETKEPFTAHTTNPVPFILVNADPAYKLKEDGCLADIAPTLIELMGMEQPAEMTGTSLLVK